MTRKLQKSRKPRRKRHSSKTRKMSWKNLTAWDNVSFYYTTDQEISQNQLKKIKRILNKYVNNSYNGHIKNNRINMHPSITMSGNKIEYNVYAHPAPLPEKFPQDIFSILPDAMNIEDILIVKKDWHGV